MQQSEDELTLAVLRPVRHGHPLNHNLLNFQQSREDSRLSQRLAQQSILPRSDLYQDPNYPGRDPSEVGTSRLVNGTVITTNASLPHLTGSTDSISSWSIPSSVGHRAVDESFRAITEEENGGNAVYNDLQIFPPRRRLQVPLLQCPFNLLPCLMEFAASHIEQWIAHSLTHLFTDESVPRRVEPPTSNTCPFCDETFHHPNSIASWTLRLRHVARHHEIGYSLAHGRPDFALYAHLWQNRVINTIAYREIVGNATGGSRSTSGQASPPINISSESTGRIDDDDGDNDDAPPRTISIVYERRSRRS